MKLEKHHIHLLYQRVTKDFKCVNSSLLSGFAGLLIFQYYYIKFCEENEIIVEYNLFEQNIDKIVQVLNKEIKSYSLCSGVSGTAYAINFLANRGIIDMENSFFDELDELLFEYGIHKLLNNEWDYLHGGLGILTYFIERNNNLSTLFMEESAKIMINNSLIFSKGIAWNSKVSSEVEMVQNFGLSHGIPSILCCLSKIIEKGIVSNDRHIKIIQEAVAYILSFENITGKGNSIFPNYILNGKANGYQGRLAWCYGDLSVAIMFVGIGKNLNNNSYIEKGIDIALKTIERAYNNQHFCSDYGFCHGFFGLSYIYLKFYDLTRNELFKNISEFLLNKGMGYLFGEDDGIKTKVHRENDDLLENFDLLSGLTGIGLVMLGHYDKKYTTWDNMLLLFPTQ